MHSNTSKLILKAVIIALLLSTVYLAIMSVFANMNTGKFAAKLMGISYTTIFSAITGAMCFSIYKNVKTQQLSLIGIVVSVVSLLLSMFFVIFEIKSIGFIKMTYSFLILSIALAQICMLYKIEIVNKYAHICKLIATIAIGLFTLCLIFIIFNIANDFKFNIFEPNFIGETMLRSIIALLVIDLGFTALTPIVNKIDEGKLEQENMMEEFLSEVAPEETEKINIDA